MDSIKYSDADVALKNLGSIITLMGSLDQRPYQLRNQDSSLLDEGRGDMIVNSVSKKVSEQQQKI